MIKEIRVRVPAWGGSNKKGVTNMGDILDGMIDQMDAQDFGLNRFDNEPHSVTCKYCGTKDLWWFEKEGKWRLYDEDSKLHICNKQKESPFEPIK